MQISTRTISKEITLEQLKAGDLFEQVGKNIILDVWMVLDNTAVNNELIIPLIELGVPVLQLSTGVIHAFTPKAKVIQLDGHLETWEVSQHFNSK